MLTSKLGETARIASYKHDGSLHRLWLENVILKHTDQLIIGGNNRTRVEETNGKVWVTTDPAIFYFHSMHWFNVVGIMSEDNFYYYCNLSSPYQYKDKTIKYIDYDLDVIVYEDRSYKVLDMEEFERNNRKMKYPKKVVERVNEHLHILLKWVEIGKGPFANDFIDIWYNRLLQSK